MANSRRRICFVTGTRAEFGLMRSVLSSIRADPRLRLQLIVTGMHLDRRHGHTIDEIRDDGWTIDAVVPWPSSKQSNPAQTAVYAGDAIARLSREFERLKSDIVMVVGDRVEAFAAAAAAHLSQRIVAHIHGGDRALGQIDDSLRHSITKLSHLHFPATAQSADRIFKLGEDRRRIIHSGSPGLDGIRKTATDWPSLARQFSTLRKNRYALLLLHPASADAAVERKRAKAVLDATLKVGFERVLVIYPNNDPGAAGICDQWRLTRSHPRLVFRKNIDRPAFLGLMKSAAVLVGNSSSGIIETASFGTPVLDIGPRQLGREKSGNVVQVGYESSKITAALSRIWNHGRPRRAAAKNVYGGSGAASRITQSLARVELSGRLSRKLIRY